MLMVAGIAMFGTVTASIAAYFVEQRAEQDLAGRLDQLLERLDRLEARLATDRDDETGPSNRSSSGIQRSLSPRGGRL